MARLSSMLPLGDGIQQGGRANLHQGASEDGGAGDANKRVWRAFQRYRSWSAAAAAGAPLDPVRGAAPCHTTPRERSCARQRLA